MTRNLLAVSGLCLFLAIIASAAGFLGIPGVPRAQAAAALQRSTTVNHSPTPLISGDVPDRCEPNDTLVQPCSLPTEVETPDLTFVAGDMVDVFSVLLKANRTYTVRAASSTGIDPTIAVYLAGATDKPIAENDDLAAGSSDAGVQVATTSDGWYLIQVENKAPGDMHGRTYSLTVRSSAPAPNEAAGRPTATPVPGDAFENNWRVEDAPHLAWDVPYDLSLVCPEMRPEACPGGDHDFFLVQTKQGIPLAALTYDLGPGADTTLAIYQPDPNYTDPSTNLNGWRLVQGNDDAVRGRTLRSQVMLTPDWNGLALIIVAASDRSDPPRVPDALGPNGRYRLIVGSPFLPAMQQVLGAEQENTGGSSSAGAGSASSASSTGNAVSAAPAAPTTPAATATPPDPGPTILPTPAAPEGDAEEIIREDCLTGLAQVISPDGARFSAAAVPTKDTRILMVFPQGAKVELLGSCYLGWVKVRPVTAVSPGWMYAPDLILIEATGATADQSQQPQATIDPDAPAVPANVAPTAQPIELQALPTRPIPAPTALPRQALTVVVRLIDLEEKPRGGVRVQLIDVTGAILRDGQTAADGTISLVADIPASAAVWLQLPGVGLTVPVDRAKPELEIVLPGG